MKSFGKNILIAVIILLAGCVSTSRKFSFKFDLMTLAQDSTRRNNVQYDKKFSEYSNEDIAVLKRKIARDPRNELLLCVLAKAEYDRGEYNKALSFIDKAIDIKNYGMMGMSITIEGIASASSNIVSAVFSSVENFMKEKLKTKVCRIVEVEKDGPADKAGLKVGDRLTFIDDIDLLNYAAVRSELEKYIKSKAPGTPVKVRKYGSRKSVTVILERYNDPGLPYRLALKSLILTRLGNTDEALQCAIDSLNNAWADEISNSLAKEAIGRINIIKGKYVEAVRQLAGIRDNAAARILEATAYAKQGEVQKAVDICMEMPLEHLSPANAALLSDREELFKVLEPAVRKFSADARKLEKKGKFLEALSEYVKAISLSSDETQEAKLRKEMFLMVQRMPELPEMPKIAYKHALRGELLVKEGKYEEARRELLAAIRQAPFIARLYFNTALVYAQIEDYPQAIRYMNIYVQAAPEAPDVRAAKDEIIKWELELEQKDE